jgi:hypothetical protein
MSLLVLLSCYVITKKGNTKATDADEMRGGGGLEVFCKMLILVVHVNYDFTYEIA